MSSIKEYLKFKGDKVLWSVIIMLMLVSVMVIYSSTGSLAYRERDGNTTYYLLKQIGLFLGCLGVLFVVQRINYRYFTKYAGTCLLIAAAYCCLPLSGEQASTGPDDG